MKQGMSLLLAGLLLAACQATSGVSFDSAEVRNGEPVRVRGLIFRPDGEGRHPAVVLLHTCGGILPHVETQWPNYLVGLGYVEFSVDTLSPRGVSSCTQLPSGYYFSAQDAVGALDYLADLPIVDADRIAVMGFSMGAIGVNSYLANGYTRSAKGRRFRAAIALYGHCRNLVGTMDALPLLEITAQFDPVHGPSCVEAAKRMKNTEAVILPGAYHAFDQPQIESLRPDPRGSMMIYDYEATMAARKLTARFLAQHMSGKKE